MKMKYLLLCLVLSIAESKCLSQKISGVYFGKIISPKNALVIKNEEDEIKGNIYLNDKDKLVFTGIYEKPVLKGFIYLIDGAKILVQCALESNSLKLHYADSSNTKDQVLHKISSKIDFDISSLFLGQNDPSIVGKWENLRNVSGSGAELELLAKSMYDFRINGLVYWAIIYAKGVGYIPVDPKTNPRQEIRWSTNNEKVTFKRTDGRIFVENYSIKGDTLIITTASGYKEFYIRK